MYEIFVKDIHIAYIASLNVLNLKNITLPAVAPTFFANIAKMFNISFKFVDVKLDYSNSADITHNFFESFFPKSKIIFQNIGDIIGEGDIYILKYKDIVKIVTKDEKIFEKLKIFLNGGIKRGRLWNYDVIDIGIKSMTKPKKIDLSMIEKSNEIVEFLDREFKDNPYFDTIRLGKKTLKTEYPILLKQSLYCPKEDIYQELLNMGIDVKVRFKPLYKLTLFKGENLYGSEELYKANLVLPLKKEIVSPLMSVLERYKKRGCRF